jgi:Fur family transcriptional regulator, ferric uptake regulator
MDTILQKIKNDGRRLTKVRKAIIKILFDDGCLLSPVDIARKLLSLNIKADRTTIYRGLVFLLENNIIKKIQLDDNKLYYEICSKHHHHLICTKCNDIKEVVLGKHLGKQEMMIYKKDKFKVLSHSLEFYGLCEKCC